MISKKILKTMPLLPLLVILILGSASTSNPSHSLNAKPVDDWLYGYLRAVVVGKVDGGEKRIKYISQTLTYCHLDMDGDSIRDRNMGELRRSVHADFPNDDYRIASFILVVKYTGDNAEKAREADLKDKLMVDDATTFACTCTFYSSKCKR